MKIVFLSLVAVMFLGGCKFKCDAEKVVAEGLGTGIANGLQCTNIAQIQTDIMKILDQNDTCKVQSKQGPIANIVCPFVASAAVNFLGNQVPANWGCNPSLAKDALKTVVTKYCELLPF